MTYTYRTSTVASTARSSRFLAVAEAWILALWIGALLGFAFFFAPVAFATIDNLDVFARLTGNILGRLTMLGYICGGLTIVIAVARSVRASDRRADLGRAAIVAVMLLLVAYQSRQVVPQMEAAALDFHAPFASVPKSDPRRVEYDRLHRQSTIFYGAVVLLGLVTIAIGTLRGADA